MANLKVDEAELVAALKQRADAYKQDLDSMVRWVLEGIAVASRASAAMPLQVDSLLKSAQVALVQEIEVRDAGEVSADIRIGGEIHQMGNNYHRPSSPAGRFRALLFLLPLP